MKYVILSYFAKDGPKILLQDPGLIDEIVLDEIPHLMNSNIESNFFSHRFGKYCSGNLIFDVPNEVDPSKKELLQISIITSEGPIDPVFSQELLKGFMNETQKIDELYKALYLENKEYEDSVEKFNALRNLVFGFGKSFPEENVLQQGQQNAMLFIFGLELAGKTTIIKRLRNEDVSNSPPPTITVDISKTLLNNLCVIIYDAPGQENLKDLWQPYLKKDLDGLVFVIDVVHRMKYQAAKEVLFEIATNRDLMDKPLLILLNKKDLVQPNVDILMQDLELNKFHGRPVKWFLTSGLTGDNVSESFSWLIDEINKKRNQQKK